jgi:hypothetical protein
MKMNEFFEKKKLFILLMWKLTLSYGHTGFGFFR